jgi:hypothetical protein
MMCTPFKGSLDIPSFDQRYEALEYVKVPFQAGRDVVVRGQRISFERSLESVRKRGCAQWMGESEEATMYFERPIVSAECRRSRSRPRTWPKGGAGSLT